MHAELSASGAGRWMSCPGSVRLLRGGTRRSGPAARQGTAAHALAAFALEGYKVFGLTEPFSDWVEGPWSCEPFAGRHILLDAEDNCLGILKDFDPKYAGRVDAVFEVDYTMVEAVDVYLEEARQTLIRLGPGTTIHVERRFDLTSVLAAHPVSRNFSGEIPHLFGTNDCCLVQPFGRVVVIDYKHGRGVLVSVGELALDEETGVHEVHPNPQLAYYGLGAIHELCQGDFNEVELVVVQPRCQHSEGPVRRLTLSRQSLLNWQEVMFGAALATTASDAPLVAGEYQCQWCEAAGACPALRDAAYSAAALDFSGQEVRSGAEPALMSDEELARAAELTGLLDTYVRVVSLEVSRRLVSGHSIAGWKLVYKKANRAFLPRAEEALRVAVEEVLGDSSVLYNPRVLKTPAQVEKLGKTKVQRTRMKALVTEWAKKPEGGLTVARERDPRPAVDPSLAAGLGASMDFDADDDSEV